MNFLIREYRPADFEALYAIDQACYSPDISYSRPELRWYLGLPGADCLVAEARQTKNRARSPLAGFIITARQKTHGHIVTIDVLAPHRRAGLGASLLRRAETRLRRRGVLEIWLETATNNDAAIAFWQKHGYRTRGRLRNYYPGGLGAFAMWKPLAGAAAPEN